MFSTLKNIKKREPRKKPLKRGRKKIVWTNAEYERLEYLCTKLCPPEEISDIMEVSVKKINELCKEHYFDKETGEPLTFHDVHKKYSSRCLLLVREKQIEAIQKGNTQMLLWYGKNYLGQKENPTIDNSLEEIKNNINSLAEVLIEPEEDRDIRDLM